MDPEWLPLLTSAVPVATALVLAVVSDKARKILRSIFRRPRQTSLIIEADGKRVELAGAHVTEVPAALLEAVRREGAKQGLSPAQADMIAAALARELRAPGPSPADDSGKPHAATGGTNGE
ncbi:hypothetical protein [Streptomyces antibioticus]|uniref:hypothetical protein n=1 Tax=Streptomyces antibioticus TaxID=1890 RepID=UPI0033DB2950